MLAIVATLPVAAAKDDDWWVTLWEWLIGTPLEIIATIVIALILQKTLGWIIRRVVLRTSERARRERLEQTRKVTRTAELSVILLTQRTEQRAAAIGSLLSSIIAITVWGVAIIVILEALSVDIAPLLASAGIIVPVLPPQQMPPISEPRRQ